MSTTTKLTDTQLVILSQAAQRTDLRVLLTPANIQSKGGAVTRALNALLKHGLITEHAASTSDEEWRRDENDAPLDLVITPAGLAAIGVETGNQVGEASGHEEAAGAGQEHASVIASPAGSGDAAVGDAVPSQSAGLSGTRGSKGAVITALLKREDGATLAELRAASGWQAHSVRGFLSGTLKKKLGLSVASERSEDGVRRYRIPA